MQGKAEDDIMAMEFSKCFVYRPAAVFGKQPTHPWFQVATTIMKPLTHLSKSIGVESTTIATAMIMNTVRPKADDKPEAAILENRDMLDLTGLRA